MATLPALDPLALQLQPFAAATAPAGVALAAALQRQGPRLEIRWTLSGPMSRLRLPEPQGTPQRRDELWTGTCLECFLARPGEQGYWELNLCPSGHWNLYRLDGYRQGLRPEPAITGLFSRRRQQADALELAVALDLACLLGDDAPQAALELGVTAVLAEADGRLSYWALNHPASEADFHHRDGFCLRLPGTGTGTGQA